MIELLIGLGAVVGGTVTLFLLMGLLINYGIYIMIVSGVIGILSAALLFGNIIIHGTSYKTPSWLFIVLMSSIGLAGVGALFGDER